LNKLLKKIDYYNIIYENINQDLSKLTEYDYCATYVHNMQKELNEAYLINNGNNTQKIKTQKLKEKFKLKMKSNSEKFINKASIDTNIEQNLKSEMNSENEEENINKTLCFYCRNIIVLGLIYFIVCVFTIYY